MSQGIITIYKLDKDYFEVGHAFRFKLDTNDFKYSILTEFNESYVVFTYLDNGNLKELKLTVEDLRFRDYHIIKLKPDYEDGKFKY